MSGRTEQSYRSAIINQEEWNAIPTERREHIIHNPRTKLAQMVANEHYISPAWCRISSTPWTTKAKMIQGFGRKIKTSTTSIDMPTYITDPNVKYKSYLADLRETCYPLSKTNPTGTISAPVRDVMAPVYVLPGGRELFKTTQDYMQTTGKQRLNYKFLTTNIHKLVVVDVPVAVEPPPPVNWPNNQTTIRNDTAESLLRRAHTLTDMQTINYIDEQDLYQPSRRRTAHSIEQRDRLFNLHAPHNSNGQLETGELTKIVLFSL
jgi:hypothetical protein